MPREHPGSAGTPTTTGWPSSAIRRRAGDWSWQFGGHHLAINVAVTGGVMSMSPSFIGIEPAAFVLDGSDVAPLRDHAAGAVALLRALPGEQRDAAIAGAGRGACTRELAGTA